MSGKVNVMDLIVSWGLTGLSYLVSLIETNPTAQWIVFAFNIMAAAGSLILTGVKLVPLVMKFVLWVKTTLKDGKISKEEIEEGEKLVDEISDLISGKEKENDHQGSNGKGE